MSMEGASDGGCVVELSDRFDHQRRVIGVLSEVLETLGFDVRDIADCSDPEHKAPPSRWRGRLYKWSCMAELSYLTFDFLSVDVPGPMSWLGVDRHALLFKHSEMAAHVVMRLL